MSGLKRRKHQRLSGRGLEGGLRTDLERRGTSMEIDNLSIGGLFARTRFPLEPDALVWFDLEHPVDRVKVTFTARVVSVVSPEQALRKDVAPGFGLAFLNVGAEEQAHLERLLAWLEHPEAYVAKAEAEKAPAEDDANKAAFDFGFKSLTDESDLSWGGVQGAELKPSSRALAAAAPAPVRSEAKTLGRMTPVPMTDPQAIDMSRYAPSPRVMTPAFDKLRPSGVTVQGELVDPSSSPRRNAVAPSLSPPERTAAPGLISPHQSGRTVPPGMTPRAQQRAVAPAPADARLRLQLRGIGVDLQTRQGELQTKTAYVRFLEQERERLQAELAEKKRRLAEFRGL